jgi:serine/threonine protein kinase
LRKPPVRVIIRAVEQDELIGTKLGPCRLDALVGRGAMGRVYRAHHLALDRTVALKLVDRAPTQALRDAVIQEARSAAKLEDPRIVAVYDVGEDRGLSYIVLQWVEGESLETRVRRRGPLPQEEALAFVREAAYALKAAHAAGIVHCDVKPANILVDRAGAVKLADFGIARHAGTQRGVDEEVAGSFHFMAPEQGTGAPLDTRSDLYALGAVWFYLLTGKPLFAGTAHEAMVKHRDEAPPNVRMFRSDTTEKVAALLNSTLEKDPERRPQSAEVLIAKLGQAGMLLETAASGSPFQILPPPLPAVDELKTVAVSPANKIALPPPPPDAMPSNALGSRGMFFLLSAILGMSILIWPWRRAVMEDWLAGAVLLASFPAFLTIGDHREIWRKAAGVIMGFGAAFALTRYVGLPGSLEAAPLETLITAAFGFAATAGALYLGFWGTDSEEALWARILFPFGGLLLGAAAVTWNMPDGAGFLAALVSGARRALRIWAAAGGPWRWGGLAVVAGAALGVRGLRTIAPDAGKARNWNR